MTSYQKKSRLITEIEAYLAFYAIVNPAMAPPRVEVNSDRMIRRIEQYSMKVDR